MKERPIIFNSEMVKAILDGRKTQTRRPVKVPRWMHPFKIVDMATIPIHVSSIEDCFLTEFSNDDEIGILCPFGKVGDRLWVRETFHTDSDEYDCCGVGLLYKADCPDKRCHPKWTPSTHMPREASRITLEITDVRVERVKDINEVSAVFEGCEFTNHATARGNFALLWNSIYGQDAWDRNDWVWVVGFKII